MPKMFLKLIHFGTCRKTFPTKRRSNVQLESAVRSVDGCAAICEILFIWNESLIVQQAEGSPSGDGVPWTAVLGFIRFYI